MEDRKWYHFNAGQVTENDAAFPDWNELKKLTELEEQEASALTELLKAKDKEIELLKKELEKIESEVKQLEAHIKVLKFIKEPSAKESFWTTVFTGTPGIGDSGVLKSLQELLSDDQADLPRTDFSVTSRQVSVLGAMKKT